MSANDYMGVFEFLLEEQAKKPLRALMRHPAFKPELDLALVRAARDGCVWAMKDLYRLGARLVRVMTRSYHQHAANAAATHGHVDALKLLWAWGAPFNGRNEDDMTPLMCAVDSGHEDAVRYLLTLPRLYLNFAGYHEATVLDIAENRADKYGGTKSSYVGIVEALKTAGAKRYAELRPAPAETLATGGLVAMMQVT